MNGLRLPCLRRIVSNITNFLTPNARNDFKKPFLSMLSAARLAVAVMLPLGAEADDRTPSNIKVVPLNLQATEVPVDNVEGRDLTIRNAWQGDPTLADYHRVTHIFVRQKHHLLPVILPFSSLTVGETEADFVPAKADGCTVKDVGAFTLTQGSARKFVLVLARPQYDERPNPSDLDHLRWNFDLVVLKADAPLRARSSSPARVADARLKLALSTVSSDTLCAPNEIDVAMRKAILANAHRLLAPDS